MILLVLFTLGGVVWVSHQHSRSHITKLLLSHATHQYCTVPLFIRELVQGSVISKGELNGSFRAQEWGYLLLLYVLLTVIRLGLFVVAYPVSSRIGLKTNWRETLFQIHAGLRGAVGVRQIQN